MTDPFTHPQVRVDMAIKSLQNAICDLQKMRMGNDTADYVLRNAALIGIEAMWLSNLSSDIDAAVNKEAAE